MGLLGRRDSLALIDVRDCPDDFKAAWVAFLLAHTPPDAKADVGKLLDLAGSFSGPGWVAGAATLKLLADSDSSNAKIEIRVLDATAVVSSVAAKYGALERMAEW
jgi:hypothetical protein